MDAEFLDKKIEKDFYNDLPGFVCESLDSIIKKYGDQPWFLEAWNEYRNHVLESSMYCVSLFKADTDSEE